MSSIKILSQNLIFKGRVVELRQDRYLDPSGREFSREVVVHNGAVCIVPRITPDEVILLRQYRYAVGRELIEIPAGTLHEGEDPAACALRELEEETGYRAGKVVEHARFWTTPGFTNELMYLYEASDLVKTKTNLDEDEIIESHIVRNTEALRMIEDGRIQDAKSILGLLKIFR